MVKKKDADNRLDLLKRQGLITLVVLTLLWSACSKSKNDVVEGFTDVSAVPTLRTLNVESLISDSGVIRYRIKAPEWLIYENAPEPYWIFPQKIYVEKFDSILGTEALIQGDTATYFTKKELWRLDKNVRIENQEGDVFLTQQIFWDQRKREIYSDSFIRIETPDEIIEGHGFTSNEQMTRYTIRKTSGIFPIKQQRDSVAKNDSAQAAGQAAPRAIGGRSQAGGRAATLDPNRDPRQSTTAGPKLKTIVKEK